MGRREGRHGKGSKAERVAGWGVHAGACPPPLTLGRAGRTHETLRGRIFKLRSSEDTTPSKVSDVARTIFLTLHSKSSFKFKEKSV